MQKRGQLDKIIATFPVLFLTVVLMGIFVLIASGMKLVKQPTSVSESISAVHAQTALFTPLVFERGDISVVSGTAASEFNGPKFVEGEYRIVPIEQKGGYLSGSGTIYGISNIRQEHSSVSEGLLRLGLSTKDFSYDRIILENAIYSFLTSDVTYISEKNVCFFASVGDADGFRPLFFERSERTSNKFQNIVSRKGIDTATFIYPVDLQPYWKQADSVQVVLNGVKTDLFVYYGGCL